MPTIRQMLRFKTVITVIFITIVLGSGQVPDTVWTKMYGTTGPFEWFQSVKQLPDSGYILCGSWDGDLLLMRTNACGDSLWKKVYGGAGEDCGFCVTYTEDGGYIITGLSASAFGDLWLLRTDTQGDTIWTKTYGGPQDDIGFWVEQTSDGGFVVCGQTESLGGISGTWLLKTDSLGDTLWSRIYQGLTASPGKCFERLADNGFFITTNILFSTNWDAYFIRTDDQGNTIWAQAYGGQFNETVTSFARTPDGGYLLAGYIGYPGATPDGWLLKIDSLGNMQWTQVYGGTGYEEFRSMCRAPNGGYILCGVKSPSPMGYVDVWLMKVDANGDSVWARTWGAGQADEGSDVQVCYGGGYVLAGGAFLAGSYDDAWLLKTEPDIGIRENSQIIESTAALEIRPNPFNNSTDIRYKMTDNSDDIALKIYDIDGREVKDLSRQVSVIGHQLSARWDGRDDQNRMLGSGVYLSELRIHGLRLIKKLIYVQ